MDCVKLGKLVFLSTGIAIPLWLIAPNLELEPAVADGEAGSVINAQGGVSLLCLDFVLNNSG